MARSTLLQAYIASLKAYQIGSLQAICSSMVHMHVGIQMDVQSGQFKQSPSLQASTSLRL